MPFKNIHTKIDEGIANNVFPGASYALILKGHVADTYTAGSAQTTPTVRPLTHDTLFDIASLTKPLCTALLCMKAVDENKLDVNQLLNQFLPFKQLNSISIKNLLNHTSGLAAYKPFYQEVEAYANSSWLINKILVEPLAYKTNERAVYSDLGYILLGEILEDIYEQSLDSLFYEKIAGPLELEKTFFIPNEAPPLLLDFAATENCPWRGRMLIGEVMDEHACLLGGMAGHAGLFSDVIEISKILLELRQVRLGKSSFIKKETFNFFTALPEKRDFKKPFFTLGFDTPSQPSSAGALFSPHSLGHLGYTGTSFWWDLEKDVMAVLLTNRVHPSRDNQLIKTFRPEFHDVVIQSI